LVTSLFMCRLSRCIVPLLSDFPPADPFRPRSGVSSSAPLRVASLRDTLLMVARVGGSRVIESWKGARTGSYVNWGGVQRIASAKPGGREPACRSSGTSTQASVKLWTPAAAIAGYLRTCGLETFLMWLCMYKQCVWCAGKRFSVGMVHGKMAIEVRRWRGNGWLIA
jgi:hypothetical protein